MYRTRNVMLEMLQDRGYDNTKIRSYSREEFDSIYEQIYLPLQQTKIKKNNKKYEYAPLPLDIEVTNKKTQESIYIIWAPSLYWANKIANYFSEDDEEEKQFDNVDSVIIILGDTLELGLEDKLYQRLLSAFEHNYTLIFYQWKQITFNRTKHKFVPNHVLLKSSIHNREFELIKSHYSLYNFNQLPIQLARDPISLYYGAKPGDIFKIERQDSKYGSGIIFRYVVKENQCLVDSSLQEFQEGLQRKYTNEYTKVTSKSEEETTPKMDYFSDNLRITDFANIDGEITVEEPDGSDEEKVEEGKVEEGKVEEGEEEEEEGEEVEEGDDE